MSIPADTAIHRWLAHEIITPEGTYRHAIISVDMVGIYRVAPFRYECASTSFFNGTITAKSLHGGGTELEFREYGGAVSRKTFR